MYKLDINRCIQSAGVFVDIQSQSDWTKKHIFTRKDLDYFKEEPLDVLTLVERRDPAFITAIRKLKKFGVSFLPKQKDFEFGIINDFDQDYYLQYNNRGNKITPRQFKIARIITGVHVDTIKKDTLLSVEDILDLEDNEKSLQQDTLNHQELQEFYEDIGVGFLTPKAPNQGEGVMVISKDAIDGYLEDQQRLDKIVALKQDIKEAAPVTQAKATQTKKVASDEKTAPTEKVNVAKKAKAEPETIVKPSPDTKSQGDETMALLKQTAAPVASSQPASEAITPKKSTSVKANLPKTVAKLAPTVLEAPHKKTTLHLKKSNVSDTAGTDTSSQRVTPLPSNTKSVKDNGFAERLWRNESYKLVGAHIHLMRCAFDFTPQRLATLAGISPSTVAEVEQKRRFNAQQIAGLNKIISQFSQLSIEAIPAVADVHGEGIYTPSTDSAFKRIILSLDMAFKVKNIKPGVAAQQAGIITDIMEFWISYRQSQDPKLLHELELFLTPEDLYNLINVVESHGYHILTSLDGQPVVGVVMKRGKHMLPMRGVEPVALQTWNLNSIIAEIAYPVNSDSMNQTHVMTPAQLSGALTLLEIDQDRGVGQYSMPTAFFSDEATMHEFMLAHHEQWEGWHKSFEKMGILFVAQTENSGEGVLFDRPSTHAINAMHTNRSLVSHQLKAARNMLFMKDDLFCYEADIERSLLKKYESLTQGMPLFANQAMHLVHTFERLGVRLIRPSKHGEGVLLTRPSNGLRDVYPIHDDLAPLFVDTSTDEDEDDNGIAPKVAQITEPATSKAPILSKPAAKATPKKAEPIPQATPESTATGASVETKTVPEITVESPVKTKAETESAQAKAITGQSEPTPKASAVKPPVSHPKLTMQPPENPERTERTARQSYTPSAQRDQRDSGQREVFSPSQFQEDVWHGQEMKTSRILPADHLLPHKWISGEVLKLARIIQGESHADIAVIVDRNVNNVLFWEAHSCLGLSKANMRMISDDYYHRDEYPIYFLQARRGEHLGGIQFRTLQNLTPELIGRLLNFISYEEYENLPDKRNVTAYVAAAKAAFENSGLKFDHYNIRGTDCLQILLKDNTDATLNDELTKSEAEPEPKVIELAEVNSEAKGFSIHINKKVTPPSGPKTADLLANHVEEPSETKTSAVAAPPTTQAFELSGLHATFFVKMLRSLLDLNQGKMAEALGVSKGYLANVERDQNEFLLKKPQVIALFQQTLKEKGLQWVKTNQNQVGLAMKANAAKGFPDQADNLTGPLAEAARQFIHMSWQEISNYTGMSMPTAKKRLIQQADPDIVHMITSEMKDKDYGFSAPNTELGLSFGLLVNLSKEQQEHFSDLKALPTVEAFAV